MPKVLLLGTSRLHRPFANRVARKVATSIQDVQVLFPKVRALHTAADILQMVGILKIAVVARIALDS